MLFAEKQKPGRAGLFDVNGTIVCLERVGHAHVVATSQRVGANPRVKVRIRTLTGVISVLLVKQVNHGKFATNTVTETLCDLTVPGGEGRQLSLEANMLIVTREAVIPLLCTPCRTQTGCVKSPAPCVAVPAGRPASTATLRIEILGRLVTIINQLVFLKLLILVGQYV